jgi:hypothetical protein
LKANSQKIQPGFTVLHRYGNRNDGASILIVPFALERRIEIFIQKDKVRR